MFLNGKGEKYRFRERKLNESSSSSIGRPTNFATASVKFPKAKTSASVHMYVLLSKGMVTGWVTFLPASSATCRSGTGSGTLKLLSPSMTSILRRTLFNVRRRRGGGRLSRLFFSVVCGSASQSPSLPTASRSRIEEQGEARARETFLLPSFVCHHLPCCVTSF